MGSIHVRDQKARKKVGFECKFTKIPIQEDQK